MAICLCYFLSSGFTSSLASSKRKQMAAIFSNGGEQLPEASVFAIFMNIASFFCKFSPKCSFKFQLRITKKSKKNYSCRHGLHETSSNCRVLRTSSELEKDELVDYFTDIYVDRSTKCNWSCDGSKFSCKLMHSSKVLYTFVTQH